MPTYRYLKSNAHNAAQTFISLMNYRDGHIIDHLMVAAHETGERKLSVDTATGVVEPASMAPPPVMESIKWYFGVGRPTVKRPEVVVRATRMTVEPELPEDRRRRGETLLTRLYPGQKTPTTLARFTCTVSIEDDRGRVHTKIVVRDYSAGVIED